MRGSDHSEMPTVRRLIRLSRRGCVACARARAAYVEGKLDRDLRSPEPRSSGTRLTTRRLPKYPHTSYCSNRYTKSRSRPEEEHRREGRARIHQSDVDVARRPA